MALGNYRGPSSYRCFVRYVTATFEHEMREQSYKIYVTDMLRNIPQMVYLTYRWADTLKSNGTEEKTAEEIVDGVIASLSGGN